ncbi:hypothetical protein CIK05_05970 [Bdellovibrio sp. qaytius]|nr:hypothetical protein CIK05_05970 [Bdellovibrio sp. qaytius]
MTDNARILFEQNEVIQMYFNDPEWSRFDLKKEAVLKRRYEFFAGRVCAALAYKKLTQKKLLELQINEDRSPKWPHGIVGSISHNEKYVVAELSSKAKGLGIDLATLGSVEKNLQESICNKDDVTQINGISSEHFLTYIFSFKESLFKAVYPLVNEFFDFQSASVTQVDFAQKTFQISLNEKISSLLSKKMNHSEKTFTFAGDFSILDQKTLLSRVIIP